MKIEFLPAGVAPPSRKTPAPFTPQRGRTVQTIPQKAKVLPVLANLKPNYIPPAVRAAMVKGLPPAIVNAVSIPGQPPMRGGQIGPGMRRFYHPGALAQGGGLDGLGNFGTASVKSPGVDCPATGSWETYCACMYEGDTLAKCLTKPSGGAQIYCPPWASAPWTECGKSARFGAGGEGIVGTGKALIGTGKAVIDMGKQVFPGGGAADTSGGGTSAGGSTGTSAGGSNIPAWTPGSDGSSSAADSSSATTIAIVVAGVVAAGGIGYLFFRNRRPTGPMGSFSRRSRKVRRNRK